MWEILSFFLFLFFTILGYQVTADLNLSICRDVVLGLAMEDRQKPRTNKL